jgi:hypothetical protein
MARMDELQYYSPGRWIYYWFGEAFGVLRPEGGDGCLLYIGTEVQVKNALNKGIRSVNARKNEILDREIAAVPEYYRKHQNDNSKNTQVISYIDRNIHS